MTDTWDYSATIDTLPPEELPVEWVWERLRRLRDGLLAASDFRKVADATRETEPWAL
jgi:hypothetical protein